MNFIIYLVTSPSELGDLPLENLTVFQFTVLFPRPDPKAVSTEQLH